MLTKTIKSHFSVSWNKISCKTCLKNLPTQLTEMSLGCSTKILKVNTNKLKVNKITEQNRLYLFVYYPKLDFHTREIQLISQMRCLIFFKYNF